MEGQDRHRKLETKARSRTRIKARLIRYFFRSFREEGGGRGGKKRENPLEPLPRAFLRFLPPLPPLSSLKLTNSLQINPQPLKIHKIIIINPNVRMNKKPKVDPIEEELKKFKKPKPIISKSSVKRITGISNVDAAGCFWLDSWIEQLVRERSYPPQLKSDDFYSLLGRYFEPRTILEVLDKARTEYRRAFPLADPAPADDDLQWLPALLQTDPNAIKDLPINYLL